MQALRQPALQQRTLGSRSSSLCSSLHLTGLRQARQAAALCPNHAARPAAVPAQQLQQHRQHRCSHVARITPFDQAWGTQIDGQVRLHVMLLISCWHNRTCAYAPQLHTHAAIMYTSKHLQYLCTRSCHAICSCHPFQHQHRYVMLVCLSCSSCVYITTSTLL